MIFHPSLLEIGLLGFNNLIQQLWISWCLRRRALLHVLFGRNYGYFSGCGACCSVEAAAESVDNSKKVSEGFAAYMFVFTSLLSVFITAPLCYSLRRCVLELWVDVVFT